MRSSARRLLDCPFNALACASRQGGAPRVACTAEGPSSQPSQPRGDCKAIQAQWCVRACLQAPGTCLPLLPPLRVPPPPDMPPAQRAQPRPDDACMHRVSMLLACCTPDYLLENEQRVGWPAVVALAEACIRAAAAASPCRRLMRPHAAPPGLIAGGRRRCGSDRLDPGDAHLHVRGARVGERPLALRLRRPWRACLPAFSAAGRLVAPDIAPLAPRVLQDRVCFLSLPVHKYSVRAREQTACYVARLRLGPGAVGASPALRIGIAAACYH